MLNTVPDLNNVYPEPVVFEEHYSIMMIAFEHGVSWSSLRSSLRRKAYADLLRERNWVPHDYLVKDSEVRRYQPQRIMTPQAHEVLYGESKFSGDAASVDDLSAFVGDRLNPDVGTIGQCESLMFTLKESDWLACPLNITDTSLSYQCRIDWVDLFFYNDGTGLLAMKVVSLGNDNGIDQLSVMNRTLRDFKNSGLMVAKDGDAAPCSFWNDLIYKQWLGFDQEIPDESLLKKFTDESDRAAGLLLNDATSPEEAFDQFQRYCKAMIVARMPDIVDDEKGMQWGRPLSDPPIYFTDKHYEALNSGEWNVTLAAARGSIVAGYATVRDMVVFELATVSGEQASLGWNGERDWQYCLEYIRKVVDNNLVEVWEYWAGMGLRDTFTFVSYDKSMPIMWQAESFYYPLYALAYHNRFRLDCLSRSIIDYNMSDAYRGRKMRDQFQRFRNQYWFQDVTTDFQGVEVYGQMKNGMGLDDQYETVSSEISDVADHLQEKWDRGTRYFFTGLAVLLAPLMDTWNTWLFPKLKEASWEELLQMGGALLVLIMLLIVTWMKFKSPILGAVRRVSRRFYRLVGEAGNN